MPIFKMESIALVQNAINAVRNVHGGYQAIDLLTKAMSSVEEPEGFDEEVREAERVSGMRYEGPDGATRSLLKTLETAANESSQTKTALIELTSLVLMRLGSHQGSKILVGLLAVAGVKPVIGAVMVRVLLLLLQSESGRKLVIQSWPKIQTYLGQLWNHSELRGQLSEVANRVGDEGNRWLSQISSAPQQVYDSVKNAGESLLDGIGDIFLAQPVKKGKKNK